MAAMEQRCEPAELVGYWTNHWCEVALVWSPHGWEDIRNIFIILGGFLGLWLAGKRTFSANSQAKTALKQAETSEAGLSIDRFQKGVMMLGDDQLFVRNAAIFILSELAENNPNQYFTSVMDVFCSFIKTRTLDQLLQTGAHTVLDANFKQDIAPDSQIALQELSRICKLMHNNGISSSYRMRLSNTNLRNAKLTNGHLFIADLSNANLSRGSFYETNFMGAFLNNSNMQKTVLISANLDQTEFYNTNLTHANLIGSEFRRSDLAGANFDCVDLSKVKGLTYAQLSKAKNVDPEFLAKLKADEEAEAAKSTEEASPPDIPQII